MGRRVTRFERERQVEDVVETLSEYVRQRDKTPPDAALEKRLRQHAVEALLELLGEE